MNGSNGLEFARFSDDPEQEPIITSAYTPVGVVVIPTNHNVYGDGSCGVISLKEMSCDTPDTGSTSYQDIRWGYDDNDTSLPNLNQVCISSNGGSVTGTSSYGYLSTDKFSDIDNPYDPETGYYTYSNNIPSPYKSDSLFNTEYSRTSNPSSTANALSDFDGIGNSKVLWGLATSQSDWKTASSITNSGETGFYPAACCCWRYHTEGTQQGDWYLPACGELGYIMPRFNKINETITNLRNAYGSSVGVILNTSNTNSYYWSSSEFDSFYARNVFTANSMVSSSHKYYDYYVRAFLRISSNNQPVKVLSTIPQSDAKVGDVALYDTQNQEIVFAHSTDLASEFTERYSPIGVVVIPASHDVYGNGKCGVMSLKEMNYDTPDEGSTSYQSMCWGGYDTYIPQLDDLNEVCYIGIGRSLNEDVQDTTNFSKLPSDEFFRLDNPYDPSTAYDTLGSTDYQSPSPYKADGSRNPAYYQTSSPSSSANALADFDGIGNSKVLQNLATGQSDWQTASTITNSSETGFYPAACCCWRYHTNGTEQGDWYLPAMGELGYMMVRFNKINETITNLINAYGSSIGVTLSTPNYYWSSSEYSSGLARRVYTGDGSVGNHYKYDSYYVRAFLRLSD